MDTTLVWAAAGAGAVAVGVVVLAVLHVARSRAARQRAASTAATQGELLPADPPAAELSAAELSAADGSAAPPRSAAPRPPAERLPAHVRGRDDLIARLAALLTQPDGRTHVLTGPGGTGKTTIALRLAAQAAGLGVPAWWIEAADPQAVTARLVALAADLGARPGEVAQAKAGQLGPADLLWRYLGERSPWLLIVDNADDPRALPADGAGLLRPTARGLIVVTSRSGDPLAWGEHAEPHAVGGLDRAAGGQLLTDRAPRAGSPKEAAALSERLGGLPLALHLAGSQLGSEFAAGQTFAHYRKALTEHATPTGVCDASLDALADCGRAQARPLLGVLSCLAAGVEIPAGMLDLEVLARACDGDAEQAAAGLAALAAVGLITVRHDPDGTRTAVTVHPLVGRAARGADQAPQTGSVVAALVTGAAARLGFDTPEAGDGEGWDAAWDGWAGLAPHLTAACAHLGSGPPGDDLAAVSRVASEAALAFLWAGSYAASERLAADALRYAARLGGDHEAVLSLRYRVASARLFRGLRDEADAEFRALLADQVRVLGAEHPDTLATRYEIARVLAERRHYEQAERELREVLAAETRILGAEHPDTLATRYEIARVLAQRWQYEQAERELREVLAAETRILGPDRPSTLATRYEIAGVLAKRGQYEQAEREYRDVLADSQRVIGTDHPDTLATRYEFALLLAERRQYAQAAREFRDLLTARVRVLGPEHRDTRLTERWLSYVAGRDAAVRSE